MHKLEKALSKARQQRQLELEKSAPKQPVTYSSAIPIQEGYLEQNHIIAHRARSDEADIFRILRTKILHTMNQSGLKTLGITSVNYGDGKTTVALNLAISIALDLKQTVLLVDLDLRKPNVAEYLGIQPQYGISDYFLDDVPIAQCLLRPSFDRMTILPAGQLIDRSSEVLGSPKIAALAEELKTRYPDRLIIYDMPPTLAQDDLIAFMPHIDAVLLVANDNHSKINELKQALSVLSKANVIGTVLNSPAVQKKSSFFLKIVYYLEKLFNRYEKSYANS